MLLIPPAFSLSFSDILASYILEKWKSSTSCGILEQSNTTTHPFFLAEEVSHLIVILPIST